MNLNRGQSNPNQNVSFPPTQVDFIDTICLPVYQCIAGMSDGLKPLVDGTEENRRHWQRLADAQLEKHKRLTQEEEKEAGKK